MCQVLPVRNADRGRDEAVTFVVPPSIAQLLALVEVEKQLTSPAAPTVKPAEPVWAVFVQVVPLSVSTNALLIVLPVATQCVVAAQETLTRLGKLPAPAPAPGLEA